MEMKYLTLSIAILTSKIVLRGPTQNFGQKLQKKNFVEKASLGMGEMHPKILGGYEH